MPESTLEERVKLAISHLDETELRLHREALEEGYKDELCSKEGCGRIFLAHKHFIMCEPPEECPMISKSLKHENGKPKSFLDMLTGEDKLTS